MCRQQDEGSQFDVIVIGGGVVGCALARLFTLKGAKVALLEKAKDILDGASKANSAILHTGFDADVGSLESRLVADGYNEYVSIHKKLGLPLNKSGALMVAWNKDEASSLPDMATKAHKNGVQDVELLSPQEVSELEPHLSTAQYGGLWIPGESVIDPWSAPYAYLLQAVLNGAEVYRDCKVLGGRFDGRGWLIKTSKGDFTTTLTINTAGLYSDEISHLFLGECNYTITPRKGQFIVYDIPSYKLTSRIILSVPLPSTKGIVICPTAFGKILVGPTAEDQHERDLARMDQDSLNKLAQRGANIFPGLADEEIISAYCGLRTATEHREYQIHPHLSRQFVTVGGIRSTGLTSALGIAKYVFEITQKAGYRWQPIAEPLWPKVNNISDWHARDWQVQDNEGIVCHCEKVTQREIKCAMSGPLPAKDFAGVKRRTRVTMGRCQGFYCMGKVAMLANSAWEGTFLSQKTQQGKNERASS